MSPIEAATDDLQDLAVLWNIGEAHAHDVVEAACAALVAGLDSPAQRILAGYTRAEAEYDVPGLLPVVLDELDLVFYPRDSVAGQDAAVRVLAHQMLAGRRRESLLCVSISGSATRYPGPSALLSLRTSTPSLSTGTGRRRSSTPRSRPSCRSPASFYDLVHAGSRAAGTDHGATRGTRRTRRAAGQTAGGSAGRAGRTRRRRTRP